MKIEDIQKINNDIQDFCLSNERKFFFNPDNFKIDYDEESQKLIGGAEYNELLSVAKENILQMENDLQSRVNDVCSFEPVFELVFAENNDGKKIYEASLGNDAKKLIDMFSEYLSEHSLVLATLKKVIVKENRTEMEY
jgi:hypothetical protein